MRQRLRCAIRGAGYAVRTQKNFPIYLAAIVLTTLFGLWLEISAAEWAILALTIGAVLITETINTAIETAVDLAHPDEHPLAGRAKDIAAGAVLLSVMMSVIVGLLLFLPPFLKKLSEG